jgi:Tat protein secretion system quality control protein TatD with DNase activity
VAETLAELKEIPLEELIQKTSDNAHHIFRINQ